LVRPVQLRAGPRLSFVYRHATRDITKNLPHEEAMVRIGELIGDDFSSAALVTIKHVAQLHYRNGRAPKLILHDNRRGHPRMAHDREKARFISVDSLWLRHLGVTTDEGKVAKGMEAKFRQINRFVEVLKSLVDSLPLDHESGLSVVDMGCGKGYLTFATYEFLRKSFGGAAEVRGIEARPELVELCNRVAREAGFDQLRFESGTITEATLGKADVLIALHACDTATDDAIAKGIQAGASLILVAPCCHKEVRPLLRAPPVLAPALKHGILLEREAEFVTDALRAALLEWAGYEAKVFEFISLEHTSKNLMIAATKRKAGLNRDVLAQRVLALAGFYGIRSQRLAQELGFNLGEQPSRKLRMDADVTWETLDWAALDRLRDLFLGGVPSGSYWTTRSDLANYDFTFAQRVGWKWNAVLEELKLRGWTPPAREALDWGCGSGIAGRSVIGFFDEGTFQTLRVFDQSSLAADFALERAQITFAGLRVEAVQPAWLEGGEPLGVLIVSHVLNELDEDGQRMLRKLIDRAAAVLWVEPGTFQVSRDLIAWREELRPAFHVLAPCTHQAGCGLLSAGNERHWCHHFAPSPAGIMGDSNWVRFGQRAGIDLRSLPYSFLALERIGLREPVPGLLPAGWSRIIGEPRFYKGYAKILSCQCDGPRELRLQKRTQPQLFRATKDRTAGVIHCWRTDGDDIVSAETLE
jgi:SAM-dependent methyltransferase